MVFAPPDIAAHLLAQRVVIVARIADRQKVAVLGIEDKQEAIEEDQGGLAHLRQRGLGRGCCDGAGKLGKDLAEDQSGKAGGNAFLVKPAFLDGSLVECARVGRTGKERLPPEDESKHLQPVTAIVFREGEKDFVMAREIEKSREIHLKKLLRDGTGALIIEPPPCTVGENAPAEFAGGQVVHAPKIAEHLGRGRGLLTPAPGAAIKWPAQRLDSMTARPNS